MGFPIELVLGLGSLFFLLGILLLLGWVVLHAGIELYAKREEKKRARKSSNTHITEELPITK